MEFSNLLTIVFFILITIFFKLFLLKFRYSFINNSFIYIYYIFILLNIDSYNTFFLTVILLTSFLFHLSTKVFIFEEDLKYLILIYKLLISYTFIKINSFIELICFIELLNWIVIVLILKKTKNNLKSLYCLTTISINIITLTMWCITYLFLLKLFKSTNLKLVSFFLNNYTFFWLNILIYTTCLMKLGAFIGPKLHINIYNLILTIPEVSYLYLYYSYIILPILILPILLIIQINTHILILALALILSTNYYYFNNNYSFIQLIFFSNQISLIYLNLFLL